MFSQLKVLRQEGSVDEYIEEIEMLAAQIPPMPDGVHQFFIGRFEGRSLFGSPIVGAP